MGVKGRGCILENTHIQPQTHETQNSQCYESGNLNSWRSKRFTFLKSIFSVTVVLLLEQLIHKSWQRCDFFKCRKDISGDSDINCRSIYTFLEKKDITRVYRFYCYSHSEGSPPQEVVMLETDSLCLSLSRDKVVSTLLPTASLYESKYNVGDAWESLWSHQQSLVNTMQSRKM